MKITVVGAGAIGAYVGARLALAGEQVTFMARGANLQALKSRGVRLLLPDHTSLGPVAVGASDDYVATGPQDLVILAVKAHQLESVADQVPRLLGPETIVVPMQNGIPYWYFHQHGGDLAGRGVLAVDPHGVIARQIPAQRVIGCVVYPATELLEPGVVKLIEGDRFPVGELDGTRSERVTLIENDALMTYCLQLLPRC